LISARTFFLSSAQVGLSPGCETAPWNLTHAKLTLNWCVQYSWRASKDALYLCENGANLGNNCGQYADDNLQAYYLTWYQVIDKNWHSSTETRYQWMKQVPNLAYSPPAGSTLPPVNPIHTETTTVELSAAAIPPSLAMPLSGRF
jgi:hypothetical protein